MTDNERMQEIRQIVRHNGCDGLCVYGTALTESGSFLLRQLEQRDNAIAELQGKLAELDGLAEKARPVWEKLKSDKELMLSALQQIANSARPEFDMEGWDDIYMRQFALNTIAQVKGEQHELA